MLTGIHLLLTYKCTYECDHCFVFGSPFAEGTFTLDQVRTVINQASKMESIRWVYFEGGEAFLFYPLLLQGARWAREAGFKVGIVTNAYFATTEQDAELWLRPFAELPISDLSVSDDAFHFSAQENPAKRVMAAAKKLGMSVGSICVEEPTTAPKLQRKKGEPIVGGGVMFRGRAAEKLTEGMPRVHWEEFVECPHEDLQEPGRVHVDAYGNVHLCQGLSLGNVWRTPISTLAGSYRVFSHPIAGPLASGGPAQLAREYGVQHEESYVDACHFCYKVRHALLDRFPQYLTPRQMYGAVAANDHNSPGAG